MNIKIYIENKSIKREIDIGRNKYRNMSEKEKQKLRKSQKKLLQQRKYQLKNFHFFGV